MLSSFRKLPDTKHFECYAHRTHNLVLGALKESVLDILTIKVKIGSYNIQ